MMSGGPRLQQPVVVINNPKARHKNSPNQEINNLNRRLDNLERRVSELERTPHPKPYNNNFTDSNYQMI